MSFKTHREIVAEYIKKANLTIDVRGVVTNVKGDTTQQVFKGIYLTYSGDIAKQNDSAKNQFKKPLVSSQLMEDAFDEYVRDYARGLREKFKVSLKCSVENLNPLRDYVKAITGQNDDLTVGVLAHWCWMVKRRLNGLPVCDHIMPILYGGQGAGKSQAVERLKDIFEYSAIDVSLDTLSDNRFSKSLTESFIGVADELSGINKADLGHLKRAITARDVSYRIMGSNSVVSAPTTISFIGCTNLPLNLQLFDSTGSRRFYQIDCQAKMDWSAINKIDYLALWKGVDESKPTGYLHTIKAALTTAQKALTVKSEVEDFMDSQGYSANGASTKEVVVGDLYSEYQTWCGFNGVRFPSASSVFGRKLSALGYKGFKRGGERVLTVATSETAASDAKQQPFDNSTEWSTLIN